MIGQRLVISKGNVVVTRESNGRVTWFIPSQVQVLRFMSSWLQFQCALVWDIGQSLENASASHGTETWFIIGELPRNRRTSFDSKHTYYGMRKDDKMESGMTDVSWSFPKFHRLNPSSLSSCCEIWRISEVGFIIQETLHRALKP